MIAEDFLCRRFLETDIETLQNGIAIGPGSIQTNTAATQNHNRNNGNDEHGIVLLGGFSDGGQLFVHDFFSFE
ncbi:MAG: hypothetical protein MZV64_19455 [Ignavibacteriales bacterium]|nr:hypothetical protein [Ignavibacteriales bacterium]